MSERSCTHTEAHRNGSRRTLRRVSLECLLCFLETPSPAQTCEWKRSLQHSRADDIFQLRSGRGSLRPPCISLEYVSSTASKSPPHASNDWLNERWASVHCPSLSAVWTSPISAPSRRSAAPELDRCGCQSALAASAACACDDPTAQVPRRARRSRATWASRMHLTADVLGGLRMFASCRATQPVADILDLSDVLLSRRCLIDPH